MNHPACRTVVERLLTMAVLLVSLLDGRFVNAADSQQPGNTRAIRASAVVTLDGDSTLHRYSLTARDVDARVQTAEGALGSKASLDDLIVNHQVERIDVLLPVDKLRSGDSHLDANMRAALGKENRQIEFHADTYKIVPPSVPDAVHGFSSRGTLSVAGVKRVVDIVGDVFRSGTSVRVVARKSLLMSDFKINPPVFMLGMLKTADLVTIKFDLLLQRSES